MQRFFPFRFSWLSVSLVIYAQRSSAHLSVGLCFVPRPKKKKRNREGGKEGEFLFVHPIPFHLSMPQNPCWLYPPKAPNNDVMTVMMMLAIMTMAN
ncbi:uncharacterized protein J3D65DRAFT_642250 [Phyllosticta citribraziliensis]|uniref:Secreted protein n=1 Tax=Phyllosticta citribraziliensis TaxID=989973 RepID=A0ABR1L2W9_9PEZI